MENEREVKQIGEDKLHWLIHEHINIRTEGDRVVLSMPWQLGASGDGLVNITVTKVKPKREDPTRMRQKYSYTAGAPSYDWYELSDGGAAIAALEKRVGDIAPLMPIIERVLYKTGMNELRAGRIITRTYELYEPWITAHHLDGFLTAMTLIASLDIMPKHTVSKFSSEREESK